MKIRSMAISVANCQSQKAALRYPTTEELQAFGRMVCGVAQPARVLQRIAQAMQDTLNAARGDDRVPPSFLRQLREVWDSGIQHGQ